MRKTIVALAVSVPLLSLAGQQPSLACGWTTVPLPPPTTAGVFTFFGVAPISPTDAWAVGTVNSGYSEAPSTSHWDGKSWTSVPVPDPPDTSADELVAVDAVSDDDIWAVGDAYNGGLSFRTLAEHWDGHSWSIIATPRIGSSYLTGVTALAPDDVWAVGQAHFATNQQSLVEHWSGSEWTRVPVPQINDGLSAIAPVPGSHRLWAVGWRLDQTAPGYALERKGHNWRAIRMASSGGSPFADVAAVSRTDVWAVGPVSIEHWNGRSWALSEQPPRRVPSLTALAAEGPSDVWTVGEYGAGDYSHAVTEHWNGSSEVVPNPLSKRRYGSQEVLTEAAFVPGTDDVWAVGPEAGAMIWSC